MQSNRCPNSASTRTESQTETQFSKRMRKERMRSCRCLPRSFGKEVGVALYQVDQEKQAEVGCSGALGAPRGGPIPPTAGDRLHNYRVGRKVSFGTSTFPPPCPKIIPKSRCRNQIVQPKNCEMLQIFRPRNRVFGANMVSGEGGGRKIPNFSIGPVVLYNLNGWRRVAD